MFQRTKSKLLDLTSLALESPTQRLQTRLMASSVLPNSKLRPSGKVADSKLDIWTIYNEAADGCKEPPINLGQGFMNFNPPDFVMNAAKRLLDIPACNQYSPSRGRPRLRKALAAAYSPLFGRSLKPESEIIVTAGANEDDGDEVIVMEPFFDQYISNITMNGGRVVYIALHPPKAGDSKSTSAEHWHLDFDELEAAITFRTKMIVLNTPHNPIGKMFTIDELTQLARIVVKHDLIMLSDEVYERLDFDPHHRIGALFPDIAERTLTVGSAGKTFGCTGWRIGWLIGHEHLISPVLLAHTRVVFSVNSPMQEATAIALEEAEKEQYYEKTVEAYKERMRVLCAVWDELGLPYTIPQGVNFAKVKIPDGYSLPDNVSQGRAKDFGAAYWLTREIGVVAIPPTEFMLPEHAHLAENYLRFATCKDLDTLHEAVRRLRSLKQYITP